MSQFLHSLRRFGGDEGGSVFAMVAISIVALVAAAGTTVDVGRGQMVRAKLQNAVDAAGLAAGASIDTSDVNGVVTKYMNVNFSQGIMGAKITGTTTTLSADKTLLTINAQASVPTTFMKIFKHTTMNVGATAQITRAAKGMELVLVMDNTGSMTDSVGGGVSKISASITAADQLLDILYGTTTNTQDNLWVGLVPFSQAVNVGTGHPTWLSMPSTDYGPVITATGSTHCPAYTGATATYTSSLPGCSYKFNNTSTPTFGSANWRGCVLARATAYDTSDDPPSVKIFQPYINTNKANGTSGTAGCANATNYYNGWSCAKVTSGKNTTYYDYSYNSSVLDYKGPNLLCPQQPALGMVAEKATVKAAIGNMKAAGDTQIDIGLAWGWRMLSPRWRGLWGGEMNTNSLPLNYNTPLMNKVVVLMTDGDNHFGPYNYTAYGFLSDGNLSTNETTAETALNTRTANLCTAMKAQGILIYTIALGTDISTTGQTLLKNCATTPDYYFKSPTTTDLQAAFQMIGDSLANLRISR